MKLKAFLKRSLSCLLSAALLAIPVLSWSTDPVPSLILTPPKFTPKAPPAFINSNGIQTSGLPDLGNPSASNLSPAEEAELGKQFMIHVRKSLPLLQDPIVNDYIQNLGARLVSGADFPNQQFYFFVVKSNTINAFAGPDGNIAVNTGLITDSQTEGQLAAVMSHEIGHVVNHNVAEGMAMSKRMTYATIAAMLAGIAIGAVGGGDLGAGAIGAATAGNISHKLNFSRENERDADQVGMQILANAGLDPYAMAGMFQVLYNQTRYSPTPPVWATDHPLTESRIADAQNFAAHYPKKHYKSSTEYHLAKQRTQVDMVSNSKKLTDHYQRILKKYPRNPYYHYGYALSLMKARQFTEAKDQMIPLVKAYPDQPIYQMGLAAIERNAGEYKQALAILKPLYALYPDYRPLVLQYAYTLTLAKNPKEASRILRQEQIDRPDDLQLLALLAQAQSDAGNKANAYATRAKILMMMGENKRAIQSYKVALEQSDTNESTKLMIKSQLERLEKLEKKKS